MIKFKRLTIALLALLCCSATAWAQVQPNGPTVTINEAKTEASFEMPQSDVTVTYSLKRDMAVDVNSTIAERIRISKMEEMGNLFAPVDADEILPVVTDDLDETSVTMQKDIDYELTLQKQGATADQWTDVTESPLYSVGTFRYKITGTGNYTGEITTAVFTLYQGYEVTVAPGEYITYYQNEALTLDEQETAAELYTVSSVTATEAVLSEKLDVAPALTPLLVYNSGSETKTFLLIPTDEPETTVGHAAEFKGTATAKTFSDDNMAAADYYVCTGKAFVWVKGAGTIGANKCWLEIGSQPAASRANTRAITGGNGTTGISDEVRVNSEESATATFYDLNGRKVDSPTKKGIYIKNGKKVVIK